MNIDNEILVGLINTKHSPIVVCDLDYRIIFMNTYANEKYESRGGEKLIGQLIGNYTSIEGMTKLDMIIEWFKENNDKDKVFCYHVDENNTEVYLVAIRNEKRELIGFSSMHECREPETMPGYVID